MSAKDDGGPAFPQYLAPRKVDPYTDKEIASAVGMSLRDWFAGIALQGMIAGKYHQDTLHNPSDKVLLVSLSSCAYDVADAMIAERKK